MNRKQIELNGDRFERDPTPRITISVRGDPTIRILIEINKVRAATDAEFQRLAAGWAHFLRVCEIIRRTDAGEPPFQVVS